MSEFTSQVKTRQQPGIAATEPADVAPLPPATLVRRRRLVRFAALMTFVAGFGLSAVPGPKGSSHQQVTQTDRGVTTVVHKFAYYRPYGVPFVVARAELGESGEIKSLAMRGEGTVGILGNLAVALGLVIVLSLLLGRRRSMHS
jgi:hypothetical protein